MKSGRCTFLDHSSAFDSVPCSLFLHKLQQFRCPVSILLWLKDYIFHRTQRTKPSYHLTSLFPKASGVLRELIFCPIFSLLSLVISVLTHLNKCSMQMMSYSVGQLPISRTLRPVLEIYTMLTTFLLYLVFALAHLNVLSVFLPFPDHPSLVPAPRAESLDYLHVTTCTCLRRSPYIFDYIERIRRICFHIRLMQWKLLLIPSFNTTFPCLTQFLPCLFPVATQDFHFLCRGFSVISLISSCQ